MFRPVVLAVVALAVLMGWALGGAPAVADYAAGVRFWGRGDFAGAAREFLPAAQAGDAESQYMMGRLYALGNGVPRDFIQAWVWFDRAARRGHTMAAEARETMTHILTPAQLAQARAAERPLLAQANPPAPTLQPQQPVEGRAVVLVPREGVVAPPRPPTRAPARSAAPGAAPARLVAPGATVEGSLLASGDLAERVREVQRALRRAGYYSGPVDGTLAPRTRQAIRAYQRDTGLPQTGLLSARMVEQLAQAEVADQQSAAR